MSEWWIEQQYWGRIEWKPLHALTRRSGVGVAFAVRMSLPAGTPRQVVKRAFWKEYKIDIDLLPANKRLVCDGVIQ